MPVQEGISSTKYCPLIIMEIFFYKMKEQKEKPKKVKNNKYTVFAIVGKSGAGKDTILREAVAAAPEVLHEIISCTTRPKRENEIDGVNYNFISEEDFLLEKDLGLMLETSEFNNWHYGTELKALNKDKINIGVFNPEGVISLLSKSEEIDLKIFYIIADDKTRLLRQLNREQNPNVKEIIRRFNTDEADFKWMDILTDNPYNNTSLEDKTRIIDVIIHWAKMININ